MNEEKKTWNNCKKKWTKRKKAWNNCKKKWVGRGKKHQPVVKEKGNEEGKTWNSGNRKGEKIKLFILKRFMCLIKKIWQIQGYPQRMRFQRQLCTELISSFFITPWFSAAINFLFFSQSFILATRQYIIYTKQV